MCVKLEGYLCHEHQRATDSVSLSPKSPLLSISYLYILVSSPNFAVIFTESCSLGFSILICKWHGAVVLLKVYTAWLLLFPGPSVTPTRSLASLEMLV